MDDRQHGAIDMRQDRSARLGDERREKRIIIVRLAVEPGFKIGKNDEIKRRSHGRFLDRSARNVVMAGLDPAIQADPMHLLIGAKRRSRTAQTSYPPDGSDSAALRAA